MKKKNTSRNENPDETGHGSSIFGGIPGSSPMIGMLIAMPTELGHEPDCSCPICQKIQWDKDDKHEGDYTYEQDKPVAFVLKLRHWRKIERLIALKEVLEKLEADSILFKRMINEQDVSVLEQLSTLGAELFTRQAQYVAGKLQENGSRRARKADRGLQTLSDFANMIAGQVTYDNCETFTDLIEEVRKQLTEDDSGRVSLTEQIVAINAELPKDLRDATEVPTLQIPAEELKDALQCYLSAKHGID